jgi:peptidyl-prolyl cis-trans isomerase A (cyclophilin A)/peptidyl-prolyl cis-trans isomerase B (cyclophilin B)
MSGRSAYHSRSTFPLEIPMLKRLLFVTALLLPAFAFAQDKTAPAKPAAAKSAIKTAEKTAAKAATTAPETAAADAAMTTPKVLIKTSMGEITVELYADKAPKSVENFLSYAKSNFYEGTVFHRVIDNFMVQGGGFTPDLVVKKTRAAIVNESKNGLSNLRGTVAMARTADPNSATAQFFINVVDNPRLDYASDASPGYCVFGKVVAGLDVVDKMRAVPTGAQGPFRSDVPATAIVIEKVTLL